MRCPPEDLDTVKTLDTMSSLLNSTSEITPEEIWRFISFNKGMRLDFEGFETTGGMLRFEEFI